MTIAIAHPSIAKLKSSSGGAVGAGLVLIVLLCIALYFGIDEIGAIPIVGLPLLAIFGIMSCSDRWRWCRRCSPDFP